MLLCLITPVYASIPPLHVEGNKIKDPDGNIVVLRGISLIDLGFLEGWEGGAINMINQLTNKSDGQANSPGWYPKAIRIPIIPADASPGWPNRFNPSNDNFYNNILRPLVDYCASKDMYAIIDWHYVANTYDKVATTTQFWQYMAPKFANDHHVIFELFNEPINNVGDDTADWLSVRNNMQTWVDIVREYAPSSLIFVAGASYSQIIGPAASNPLTGNNIAIVSHIYPGHWLSGGKSWYVNHITTCAAVYPVVMTEWGFTSDPDQDSLLIGTIANYGQPLSDFREQRDIGSTAWVASDDWGPPMFVRQTDPPPPGTWALRIGPGEMGGFTKDLLYSLRNDDQPVGGYDNNLPTVSITSPLDGAKIGVGDDIVIEASASDSDGSVAKVRFYQGSTRLCEDTTSPYSCTWSNAPVGHYSLTARAIDNDGDITTSSAVNIEVIGGAGKIFSEAWGDIPGTEINDLTSNVNYPNKPTVRVLLTTLEWQTNIGDNYGVRIRGYVHPVTDGDYTFWIASADSSELWLSTDADPCHISKIAYVSGWTDQYQWDKYPQQQSAPISIVGGNKRYIEVLYKAGSGSFDNLAVAWERPGASRQVIDGRFMSPCCLDFRDFAGFAVYWHENQCEAANSWCFGADFDNDGSVLFDDLKAFVSGWLAGIE
jgi:hypothetical protein